MSIIMKKNVITKGGLVCIGLTGISLAALVVGLSVCLSGNSQAQIKKGIDVIAALGVFLQPK